MDTLMMQFKFVPKGIKIGGTSFCGRIGDYTKTQISKVFGKSFPPTHDTTGEWHFTDERKRPYVVYDYKGSGWHVGAKSNNKHVKEFIAWFESQMGDK